MCSHALMSEESTKQIKAAGVDRIITTNSVPKMEAFGAFVEAIDLSPVIAPYNIKVILLTPYGESLLCVLFLD